MLKICGNQLVCYLKAFLLVSSTRPHFIEDQKGLITSRLSISPPNSEIIHHNNGMLAAVLRRVGSLELLLLSPAHRGMHSSASQSRNFPKSSQNGQLQYWDPLTREFLRTPRPLSSTWPRLVPEGAWLGSTKTGVYATDTVAARARRLWHNSRMCKWYQASWRDYWRLIVLNFTITVSLFEAINPQINTGCSPYPWALLLPTAGWNQTMTMTMSSYDTVPSPTPSGTTANCYEVRVKTWKSLDSDSLTWL